MDVEARIAELEAQLAEAQAQLKRLRGLESENAALKARVEDLHTELVTLRPPNLPRVSGVPRHSSENLRPSAVARRERKNRLMTWTTLILVLAGAALASLPYLLNHLSSQHGDQSQFTNQRGLGSGE